MCTSGKVSNGSRKQSYTLRNTQLLFKTRMHSRMRTARFSGRLGGWGVCLGVSTWGGVCPGGEGGLPEEFLRQGCLCRGESVWGVYTPIACRDTPPPMNRMTDRCKNITFPQLRLRAVINRFFLTNSNCSVSYFLPNLRLLGLYS